MALSKTGLDTPDDFPTRPTREQNANDRVPASRDLSKQIDREQRRTANPSR